MGSKPPDKSLGALWRVLPADTRLPGHSIWSHLDATTALAGIFSLEKNPALFNFSLNDVQSLIGMSRSMSDFWSGSHLVSSVSWEAMRVVVNKYGPDQNPAVASPGLQPWG